MSRVFTIIKHLLYISLFKYFPILNYLSDLSEAKKEAKKKLKSCYNEDGFDEALILSDCIDLMISIKKIKRIARDYEDFKTVHFHTIGGEYCYTRPKPFRIPFIDGVQTPLFSKKEGYSKEEIEKLEKLGVL